MMSRSLFPTTVLGFLLLYSAAAFKSRPTLYIRLQQQLSTSALSATSLSNAAFPTNNLLLQQLMAASMKKKLIFIAHPIAIIVLFFLLKQLFFLLPTVLPKLTVFLLSVKKAFGNNKGKEGKTIGVDNNGKRFYGIAQPITQENIKGSSRIMKKRVTVATLCTDSTSSIEMARARVASILATLDDESSKASTKAVKSQSVGSWSSLMHRDVEKEGKDAYLAKVKRMEQERAEKIIKQKKMVEEAEASLKQQQQQQQQQQQPQIEEIQRKRREAAAAAAAAETKVVINTHPSITPGKTSWTPHMMILKS